MQTHYPNLISTGKDQRKKINYFNDRMIAENDDPFPIVDKKGFKSLQGLRP